MYTNYLKIFLILLCFFVSQQIFAQSITGKVIDKSTQQAISGVNVLIEGTYIGTSTDAEGKFKLNAKEQNVLVFSFVGYQNQKITVTTNVSDLEIVLEESTTFTNEVIVSASRIEEKIMQTPVTVEKISQKTLETSASTEIMNMLARFKGIDVSSSSMLYSAITTRGFNSVKSERMIQLADYMDYASPSLNLYAGNAFGVSDIDLESVDVIYGANSALYGANAFNGVILFHSKDPFKKEGLTVNVRGGSRNLADMSLRFAKKLGNRFAFKIVAGYMEANEFIADNQD
ncbi:MAG: TonB-dependent receptor, partial [Bacteroidetes bacterium]